MSEDRPVDSPSQFSTEMLMPRVYDELRRLAVYWMNRHAPGQRFSGTALVHEAYLRLSKEGSGARWVNQDQFFSAAAEAMRRVLIERMRAKQRIKRGGEFSRIDMEQAEIALKTDEEKLIEIDDALNDLMAIDPDSADLVRLRFFAGFTLEEIAEARGISVRTVTRQWAYARAWLLQHLSE